MTKIKIKKINIINYLYIFLILFVISLLIINPTISIRAFTEGLRIWATNVLPALLPFFILTNLLSYTTFTKSIGRYLSPLTQKLYGVGGVSGYIFSMSILSGYPVGAKLISDFYKNNIITSGQASSITSFTSTSGPLFVIGTVGIGFFKSQKIGIIILISHYISAILNGFLYRNKDKQKIKHTDHQITNNNILNTSMTNSIMSIMLVGGFIALFYMLLNLMISINGFGIFVNILNIFGIDKQTTIAIISGIIEVTSGALALSKTSLNINSVLIILSFFVSFGGLSIHAQAYSFLKDFNMPYFKFLLQKITHAILSASVTFIITLFI